MNEPEENKNDQKNDGAVSGNDELEKLQKQTEEYLSGWKRAKADFINYQKDENRRFQDFAKFSNEALIKEMLVVGDSLSLAHASLDKKDPAQKGIAIIKSQLEGILKNQNVEPIEPLGEAFNPAYHEAILEEQSDKPAGTIIEVIETGYKLHGKVIRAAKVKIAK